MLGFIHYQLVVNLLQFKIRSLEALLFPKKLVFRVGQKSGARQTSSFAIFEMQDGLCDLQMCLAVWVDNSFYKCFKVIPKKCCHFFLVKIQYRSQFLNDFFNIKH